MTLNRILATLVLIISILQSNWAVARSDDSTKPINIKADSAEINDASGISVYRGNVEIIQGTMHLTGEKVVLKTLNKKVQKITSEGNLSTFKQTKDDGKVVYAEAEKMVYNISANEIVLTKNAKVTEGGNAITSERIVFYTDKEIYSAGSETGDDRVNITVIPETLKKEENKEQ